MGMRADVGRAIGIGWRSFRATVIPLLLIWGFAALLVVAYYFVAPLGDYFAALEDWHARSGIWGVVANRVVFCGLVPAAFMLSVKGLREPRVWAVCIAQTVWSIAWGVICNKGFQLQARWFGSGNDWVTLCLKTGVDQFVFTPFVISPASAAFCFWLARDLSFARTHREWPQRFYRNLVLPNLLANWCISIPVTFAMFSFPTVLQIHVNSLNMAFASQLFLQIGRRTS